MAEPDVSVMVEDLWARDDKIAWLTGRGLTEETIAQASLGYVPEDARTKYWDCISIPYYDARGELVTVRFRHLRDDPPTKYQSPKGGGRHLYNVRVALEEPVVAICEGEFDALVMSQVGVPAVALPGVNTWQREWRWLFRNCDLVYLAIDNATAKNPDALKAETKARNRITAQVGMLAPVEVIQLPSGHDVTDLYLKDPDELRRALA